MHGSTTSRNKVILEFKKNGVESGFSSLKERRYAWDIIFEMKANANEKNQIFKKQNKVISENALEQIKFDVQRSFTMCSGAIFFDENKA